MPGLFDGLSDARTGNGFDKADYPTHGSYITLLMETDLFKDRAGYVCGSATLKTLSSKAIPLSPKVTLVTTKDASGVPFITPNPVGREVKLFWKFERSPNGELTFKGLNDMNRFKGFLKAVLGGDITGVKEEQMSNDVALAVMLGSSRLATSGSAEDKARLAARVQKDFGLALDTNTLLSLAGQFLGLEVRYDEYTPKQGKNMGKLVSSSEYSLRPLSVEDQAVWAASLVKK